jgi:hypothetical protein
MSVFNVSCLEVKRDPETGCAYNCGERQDYQSCRQAFFLKEQNEILKQDIVGQTEDTQINKIEETSIPPNQQIEDLKLQLDTVNSRIDLFNTSAPSSADLFQTVKILNSVLLAIVLLYLLLKKTYK